MKTNYMYVVAGNLDKLMEKVNGYTMPGADWDLHTVMPITAAGNTAGYSAILKRRLGGIR